MTDADKVAVKELEALVQIPGSLRVITSEHLCGGAKRLAKPGERGTGFAPKTDAERDACEAFEIPLTDFRHFVVHEVVDLTGPNHIGLMRAHTAEGDWCEGKPAALLARLREARQA